MKPSEKLFLEQNQSQELGVQVGEASRKPQDRGERPPPGRAPCLVDDSETPPDVRPTPKIPINTETPEKKPRSGVSPPQASAATENQSRPVPAPCLPEGGIHHRWPSSSSRRSA